MNSELKQAVSVALVIFIDIIFVLTALAAKEQGML